jgi:hypothetical protein
MSRTSFSRRAWAPVLGAVLIASVAACDCGDTTPPPVPPGACGGACVPAALPATNGSLCCESSNMCVSYDLLELCEPGFRCAGPDSVSLSDSCELACSTCERQPALQPGLLATYLDMNVAEDGTIMMSGYSPGHPPAPQYGDLVIGPFDPASSTVTWEIVDGAPDSPITNDPEGWRGGVSAAGDDVGRWTSIAESDGTYYVSYYDRTHGALKIAVGVPGAWTTHVIDEAGDSGRYSSIAIDETGVPAISYLKMEAATDGSGQIGSSAMVAIATSPMPSGPADWVATTVASSVMACRPDLCADGVSCLASNGLCGTDTGDCAAACVSGEICFMGTCEATVPDNFIEDMPPAFGMYTSLVRGPTHLVVAFYDRTQGNVMAAARVDGVWTTPRLIDGYGVGDPSIGDSGIGTSLFVDDLGNWHLSYVDGAEETLRYAFVDSESGTVVTTIVDDGSTDGTAPNPDGRHIVGDDSSIAVTAAGNVRIAYQDASSTRLMYASRDGAESPFALEVLDPGTGTGFWVEQVLAGEQSYIGTFWQDPPAGENGVRVLMP